MMPVSRMKELLRQRGQMVEENLAACLDGRAVPQRLKDSMLYSLQAGGKRLRPVLCLSTAAMCGLPLGDALPFASAIEMVGDDKKTERNFLLASSDNTHILQTPAEISLAAMPDLTDKNYFNRSYVPVGVVLEGEFQSDFTNRLPPEEIVNPPAIQTKSVPGRQIMIADGDISFAIRLVRCLNKMEALILPKLLAELAVKQYPTELSLKEKLTGAANIYLKVAQSYFKRSA